MLRALCAVLIVAAAVTTTTALPSEWGEDAGAVTELLQAEDESLAPPASPAAKKPSTAKTAPAAKPKAAPVAKPKAAPAAKAPGGAKKSGVKKGGLKTKKKKKIVPFKKPVQSGPERRVTGGVKYKAVLFNALILSGAEEKMFYQGKKP